MAKRFLSNIRINDAYTFPASDGLNNQVIKTDGSGNLSFAQLAADSASVMYKDTFTGNGSTTVFNMANALNDEVQSNIYIDGVYQSKSTYSIANKAITFSTAPASGHEIEVISTTGINSGPTAIYTDTFTANGSTTAFTLAQTVHSENQTIVFLNGVYQFKGTYTLSGTTLTLDTAPANGVSIEVMSIGSAYSGGDILYDHDFGSAGLMTTNGSGVYSITANNSANWNTAYGWGDHGLSAQDKTDIGNLSGTNTGDQDLSSYATQSYVGTQISNLVDSSPSTLNTLNELAAALGDDPNFATTTATNIGTKMPLAGGTFTGNVRISKTDATLEINNSTASLTNADLYISVEDTGQADVRQYGAYPLAFWTNNTQKLTIDSSGEVQARRPRSNTAGDVALSLQPTDSTINYGFRIDSTNNAFNLDRVDSALNLLNITASGNVGINKTSPSAKLEIVTAVGADAIRLNFGQSADIFLGFASANPRILLQDNSNVVTHNFQSNADNYIVGSNVGIGTTSPTTALSVSDGASMYGNSNYLVQIKRNATNGNDNTSKASILLANNSNAMQIAYGGSTDRLRFIDGGADERFTMLNGGNIGIGDTSPSYKLVVAKSNVTEPSGIDANTSILIKNNTWSGISMISTEATGNFITFGDNAAGFAGRIQYSHATNAMQFETAASERMRITSRGDVGIGTSSPDQTGYGYKTLTIVGGTNHGDSGVIELLSPSVSAEDQNMGIVSFGAGSTRTAMISANRQGANNAANLRFWTSAGSGITEKMRIASNGNVGIGTASPGVSLDIARSGARIKLIDGTNQLNMGLWDGSNYRFEGDANRPMFFTSYQGNIKFGISGGTTMTIKSSSVGIGTTLPEMKLDVKSNSDTAPSIYLRGGKSSQGEIQNTGLIVGTQTDMVAGDYQGISFTGYTSSSAIRRGRAAIGVEAINGPGKMDLVFLTRFADDGTQLTSADEKMRITGDGKVGIGQTSPAHRLDVRRDRIALTGLTAGTGGHYIALSGQLPGYGANQYNCIETNLNDMHFSAGGVYTGYISFNSGFTDVSDRSLKENIEDIPDALDKVSNLRGRYFTWKNELQSNDKQVGFIAQEVEEVLPEIVTSAAGGTKGISYGKMTALLVNAIKELKEDNDSLKARIETLENN